MSVIANVPASAAVRLGFAAVMAVLAGSALAGEFDCLIEPRQVIEIRAAVQGLIDKVWVDRGDIVKQGQVLVTLDAGLERASVELAKFRAGMMSPVRSGQARVDYASLKSSRKDKLLEQHYISAQERDEAATEQRLAQAELDEANDNRRLAQLEYQRSTEQLRLRTLLSPTAGVVVERLMNAGDLADAGDNRKPILKIADVSMLYVEVLLPTEAYGAVRPGNVATVTPDLPGVGPQQAKVKSVDSLLDPASGTFRVRLELPNPTLKLPGGVKCIAMLANVKGDMRSGARFRPKAAAGGSVNAVPSGR